MKLDKAMKKTWWVLKEKSGEIHMDTFLFHDIAGPALWPTKKAAQEDAVGDEKPVAVRLVLKEGKK